MMAARRVCATGGSRGPGPQTSNDFLFCKKQISGQINWPTPQVNVIMLCPWTPLGLCPRTPFIGSRSAVIMSCGPQTLFMDDFSCSVWLFLDFVVFLCISTLCCIYTNSDGLHIVFGLIYIFRYTFVRWQKWNLDLPGYNVVNSWAFGLQWKLFYYCL